MKGAGLNPRIRHILKAIVIVGATVLSLSDMVAYSSETVDLFRQKRLLDSAQIFLDEGRRELAHGSYTRSIRVLTQAINRGADPEAFKLRGKAYSSIGALDKAIDDFSSYIGAGSADPEGYLLRGDAYSMSVKHERALPDFTRAVELEPSRVEAYLGRGIAHLGLEQYGAAIKDFRSVLERDPKNTDALINLGLAYSLADRPAEAKNYFEKALEADLDPKWKLRLAEYIKDLPTATDSKSLEDLSEEYDESDSGSQMTTGPHPGEPPVRLQGPSRKASIGPGLDPKVWSGHWEGTYMGSKLTIEFRQTGGKINGVLRVRGLTGHEDVFHFRGLFDGRKITARHGDGHSFDGKVTENRRIVGVLTAANGIQLNIDLPLNQ
jgi:lipoprotein NlpI